jgi:RimJ/RimL family protein N-acetyltransferase
MAFYRKQPIVTLETKRLLLRPLRELDAPRVQSLFPNYNLLRYMNAAIPWPYPEDGAISFIRSVLPKMEAQEEYYWAIVQKGAEDEALVGVIGLTPASDEDHRGFWIGEPYWRRGYVKEASAAVNDFAFETLGMQELLLGNAEANLGSHRVKEAAGAEIVSRGMDNYVSGQLPSVRWRLTAEAWSLHREAFLASGSSPAF